MKYVVFISILFVGLLTGFALKSMLVPHGTNKIIQMSNPDRQLDEAGIRNTEAAYDVAWRQGDIEGILVCFTEDALLISPRGDVAKGKDQLRSLFSSFLQHEARDTKHTSRISRISFVTDDVAVVDGEAFIEGSVSLSDAVKQHSFTDILVRTEKGWLISQIRASATN
jgi:uncharacterized protein (TIGR02246 family)